MLFMVRVGHCKMLSGLTLSNTRSNGRKSAEDSRHEDTATTTEQVVQRIRAPASKESRSDVGTGVNQTLVPLVALGIWVVLSWDTKSCWERQVGTVGTGLIPGTTVSKVSR